VCVALDALRSPRLRASRSAQPAEVRPTSVRIAIPPNCVGPATDTSNRPGARWTAPQIAARCGLLRDSVPRLTLPIVFTRAGVCRRRARKAGICGSRSLKYRKHENHKVRTGLFLRLRLRRPPEWGSGGRWFESSRPDIARLTGTKSCGEPCSFPKVGFRPVPLFVATFHRARPGEIGTVKVARGRLVRRQSEHSLPLGPRFL
jgi:hypothetical protein